MASADDIQIVHLLRSNHKLERDKGALLFERCYKNKAIGWVSKKYKKLSAEDIWQSAALEMIFAIQNHKYEPRATASLYTYFHCILHSTCFKEVKGSDFVNFDDIEFELADNELTPDTFTELQDYRAWVTHCLDKLNKADRLLIKKVIYLDQSLSKLVDELNLKNYNNAKQRFHSVKKKLLACLRNIYK